MLRMAKATLILLLVYLTGCTTLPAPPSAATATLVLTLDKKSTMARGRDNAQAASMVKGYRIRVDDGRPVPQVRDAYFPEGQTSITVSFRVSAPSVCSVTVLGIGAMVNGDPAERTLLGRGNTSVTVTAGTSNVAQVPMVACDYSLNSPVSVSTDLAIPVSLTGSFLGGTVELFYSSSMPTSDCAGTAVTMADHSSYLGNIWYTEIPAQTSPGTIYIQTRQRLGDLGYNDGVRLSLITPCISDGEALRAIGVGDTSISISPTW